MKKSLKIIVINGSPAGTRGATAHYTQYLGLQSPQHSYETFEVGREIRSLTRDRRKLDRVLQAMVEADLILWAFPVYKMLIPAQLKAFIELLFAHPRVREVQGTMATALSTSAKFYDHTAHAYIHAVSSDLGLRYVRGYSAHMDDLLHEEGRRNVKGFADEILWKVAREDPLADSGPLPIRWTAPDLTTIELPQPVAKTGSKRVVIISDEEPTDHNLRTMIEVFDRSIRHPVQVVRLRSLNIKGGCLGCLHCGDGGPCVYKDEYEEAFRLEREADILIHAGAARDRYLSARFKTYLDRYFSNGHRFVHKAGLMGCFVSGPLSQLGVLRETLEAGIELAHVHRLGIVSDESPDPQVTITAIQAMARAAERWETAPWKAPPTFLGVGGHKVFRDLVYHMRGVMVADHRFYRTHGLYDFPQRDIKRRVFNRSMLIAKGIPGVRSKLLKSAGAKRVQKLREVLESEGSQGSAVGGGGDNLGKKAPQ
jgi:multimeric flavodoxin WrbA